MEYCDFCGEDSEDLTVMSRLEDWNSCKLCYDIIEDKSLSERKKSERLVSRALATLSKLNEQHPVINEKHRPKMERIMGEMLLQARVVQLARAATF